MANAWQTIKRLTRGQGGKTVVVEGEQATHVVLTIEEYEHLIGSEDTEEPQSAQHTSRWSPPSQPASKQDEPTPTQPTSPDSPTPGSIRIEDLPL